MKKFYFFVGLWVALFSVNAQQVATFDDVVLESDSYWNGADGSGEINSGGFMFPNDYDADWGSWSGFSVSNMKDSVTAGWGNQYSAITASGHQSENYAVVYASGGLEIIFENPLQLTGFYVTNSTYAYLSMKEGDAYSKKFGGEDGKDPDYFKLTVSATDIFGNETAVDFYLADFTSDDSANDYILKTWEWLDLSSLGVVTSLSIGLESSDVSDWGMNTPAYFCIDDFNGSSPDTPEMLAEADFENLELEAESFYNGADATGYFTSGGFTFLNDYNAEWGSWSGFAASTVTDNQTEGWSNQYSAIPGSGALETSTYAVSYASMGSEIHFEKTVVSGFYITNSTYAYLSMRNGDAYSKKFGGENGSDSDWFKVDIFGISEAGDTTGTIEYYLADFRSENSSEDYIVNDWKWLDLSSLGEITTLKFNLSSSDVGDWGMNTPAYFCIDQLNHQDLAPEIAYPLATIADATYPDNVYYISLDSVFTDPDNDDSEMTIQLETIDNQDLLIGAIVQGGTPDALKTLLSLNITENMTGSANITISATSNGKKVYHTFEMLVSVPVSSDFISENEEEIKVYPNPVESDFSIELPANAEQVFLFDISGKIIYRNTTILNQNLKISALQNSPAGIYFLKVKLNSEYKTEKVVKL
ncbi:DUF4465 domain-containing protein [Maribellus comscasis]|uniref:DUF4465 domain-containing protein n=1 Tax=Maribellus comscasis TaxID=2681766 RepID=A0A6I6JVF9_9BACT|nr:DUF4465 domain-containing protein [Maribellus comscasis]QGY47135.1 DUF4465 domain-containing protein [Maribellus comscasis]